MERTYAIDIVAFNRQTGFLELCLLDDGNFSTTNEELDWLAKKLTYYMNFIESAEKEAIPEYRGKPARIIILFNRRPPVRIRQATVALAARAEQLGVSCVVTETGVPNEPVDLAGWASLPDERPAR
jgi:hypothetical protein